MAKSFYQPATGRLFVFWVMASHQWQLGAWVFKRAWWSHLQRCNVQFFTGHSTIDKGNTTLL